MQVSILLLTILGMIVINLVTGGPIEDPQQEGLISDDISAGDELPRIMWANSCSHCYPTGSATVCNVGWNREYCLDEMDGLCSTTPGKTRLDGYNEACKPKENCKKIGQRCARDLDPNIDCCEVGSFCNVAPNGYGTCDSSENCKKIGQTCARPIYSQDNPNIDCCEVGSFCNVSGNGWGTCDQVVNLCDPSPCGPGAKCMVNSYGNAVCRCDEGLIPDPDTITGCKPECIRDPDCYYGHVCENQKCIENLDVCDPSPCGPGANCMVHDYGAALCRCDEGLIPNPDTITGCKPE